MMVNQQLKNGEEKERCQKVSLEAKRLLNDFAERGAYSNFHNFSFNALYYARAESFLNDEFYFTPHERSLLVNSSLSSYQEKNLLKSFFNVVISLSDRGIHYSKETKNVYEFFADNIENAREKLNLFFGLRNIGFVYTPALKEFYLACSARDWKMDLLLKAFKLLHEHEKFKYSEETKALYFLLIEKKFLDPYQFSCFVIAFMYDNNLSYCEGRKELYIKLARTIFSNQGEEEIKLPLMRLALRHPYNDDNKSLYNALIAYANDARRLQVPFSMLHDKKYFYQDGAGEYYDILARNMFQQDKLLKAFLVLLDKAFSDKATQDVHVKILDLFIKNINSKDFCDEFLEFQEFKELAYSEETQSFYLAILQNVEKASTFSCFYEELQVYPNMAYDQGRNKALYLTLIGAKEKQALYHFLSEFHYLQSCTELSYRDLTYDFYLDMAKILSVPEQKNILHYASDVLLESGAIHNVLEKIVEIQNFVQMPYEENSSFYRKLIEKRENLIKFPFVFPNLMKHDGFSCSKDNKEFHMILLDFPRGPELFLELFESLQKIVPSIRYDDRTQDFWCALARDISNGWQFLSIFSILQKFDDLAYSDLTFPFYVIFAENIPLCNDAIFFEMIEECQKIKFPYTEDTSICYFSIMREPTSERLQLMRACFEELSELGFSPNNEFHREFYKAVLLTGINDPKVCLKAIFVNLAMSSFPTFYDFISSVNTFSDNPSALIDSVYKVKNLNPTSQSLLLESIANASQHALITMGPLKKTQTTFTVEALLIYMATLTPVEFKAIEVSLNALGQYEMRFLNGWMFNLTLLLNNSNFNHLVLEDAVIEKFESFLKGFIFSKYISKKAKEHPSFDKFPNILIRTVAAYTTNEFYKNLNVFFRGEVLEDPLLKHVPVYFLLGSLISVFLNRLAASLDEKVLEEKLYLRRDLSLSDEACNDLLTLSAESLPALTSTTARREKLNFLLKREGETTIYFNQGLPPTHFIDSFNGLKENGEESECLYPPGTHVRYHRLDPRTLLAEIVCSPDFGRDSYCPQLALAVAYEHLKKPYKDCQSTVTILETLVNRPNHALAHTYRKMLYLPLVINYAGYYAKDKAFKDFCFNVRSAMLEWLQIAMAFSVTGRQSEVSFKENPVKYQQYKQASRDNFIAYALLTDALPSCDNKEKMIQRLADAIEHMGAPHYISEDKQCIYLQRLLSFAHDLDLPRCYTIREFKAKMALHEEWVERSSQQAEGLRELMGYAIDVMKKHGNALSCEFNSKGQLVDTAERSYERPFGRVSGHFGTLFRKTALVRRPEPEYDFSSNRI